MEKVKYTTYTYRIYPNKKQRRLINLTFKMCRKVFNILLKEKATIHFAFVKYSKICFDYGKSISQEEFVKRHKLTKISEIKKIDENFYKVDSLALCSELNNVNNSFENFYSGRCQFPKYKKRKDKNSYTTSQVNNNIRIQNNKIRLPKIGFVKAKIHRNLPTNSRIKQAVVKEDKCGRYFVAIVLEIKEEVMKKVEVRKCVGLDFKVGNIFVSSDNFIPDYIKPYKTNLHKLHIIEQVLAQKQKFSKSYFKIINKIRKLHRKIFNIRQDFLHKLSTKLVKQYDLICCETLSLVEISKKLWTGINVYDTSYNNFTQKLIYKSNMFGKNIIFIDKWFPSSKLCNNCNNRKKKLKLSQKVYKCNNCGIEIDRDLNAAINIKNEGLRIYKQSLN